MLNRLTIGRKLFALVAAAQVLMLVMGLGALRSQSHLRDSGEAVAGSVDAVRESVLSDMAHDAIRGDVLEALQGDGPRRAELVTQTSEDVQALLDHLDAVAASGMGTAVSDAVAALRPEARAYGDSATRLTRLAAEDPVAAAGLLDEFGARFTSLEEHLPAVADAVVRAKDANIAAAATTARSGRVSTILGQIVAMALLAALALATHRSMLTPIRAVLVRLREISTGDGDLTQRLDDRVPGEIGQLGGEFNQFSAKLAGAMRDISERATMVAAASEQLATVSTNMRSGAQASEARADAALAASQAVQVGVTDIDRSASELSSAITDIAANAAEAARVAAEAVDIAATTGSAVSRLADHSSEITSVVETITGIAQQTNLLALNATIEAARAGDAGRGFAVVATEVKDLAGETAAATGAITSQVEAIQFDSGATVDAIHQIVAVVHRINETQGMIAAAVEQQSAATAEIARTIQGTDHSSQIIREAVDDVREAILVTSDGARDNERAAQELAAVAGDLQRLVGRFRF
jgi:methyl-accepting chemotaxis protein